MKKQLHIVVLVFLGIFCLGLKTDKRELKAHTKSLILMGSAFSITVIHENEQVAWNAINAGIAEIERITALISSWDKDSQTSEINRQAGLEPVKVDKELYDLIYRAGKVSQISRGAFDLSFAAADRIWKFDGSMTEVPDGEMIKRSVEKIGWEQIELKSNDDYSIFLREEGMKIGFGAIGKGYAANRAKAVMQEMGIENGLVNAGGDLMAWGHQVDGKNWQIGVADPKDRRQVIASIDVTDMAVVTSGDYERFAMIDGKRYAHIIDPRTGWPAAGLKSVTIICPDAEAADAMATAVFVLGPEKGLELINQLKGFQCILVDDNDQFIISDLINLNFYSKSKPKGGDEWQAEIGIKN